MYRLFDKAMGEQRSRASLRDGSHGVGGHFTTPFPNPNIRAEIQFVGRVERFDKIFIALFLLAVDAVFSAEEARAGLILGDAACGWAPDKGRGSAGEAKRGQGGTK